MTLRAFLNLLNKETKGVDLDKTNVLVLSTFWSEFYGGPIDAPVTGVGLDENHGSLYIEINKTDTPDENKL